MQPDETSQPPTRKLNKTTTLSVVFMLVVLIATGWLWQQMQTLESKLDAQAAFQNTVTNAIQQQINPLVDEDDNGWSTTVTSGKGKFRVSLPDGWGPLINLRSSDLLVGPGRNQPELTRGVPIEIEERDDYGTDSPSFFTINITNSELPNPEGEQSDFVIGKADEELRGEKFSYIYQKDAISGIGYMRYAGDRDYIYRFKLSAESTLYVRYSVYGQDPRNLDETVDSIVQSIRIND